MVLGMVEASLALGGNFCKKVCCLLVRTQVGVKVKQVKTYLSKGLDRDRREK